MGFFAWAGVVTIKIIRVWLRPGRNCFHARHEASQARTDHFHRVGSDLLIDLDEATVINSRATGDATTDHIGIEICHKLFE